jgi:hypothetical protein
MKTHKGKHIPLGMTIFVVTFICAIVATQVQRVRYIAYLHDQGISSFSIWVSPDIWLPFHCNVLSVLLDAISVLPFVLIAIGLISRWNKRSGQQNKMNADYCR